MKYDDSDGRSLDRRVAKGRCCQATYEYLQRPQCSAETKSGRAERAEGERLSRRAHLRNVFLTPEQSLIATTDAMAFPDTLRKDLASTTTLGLLSIDGDMASNV